MDTGLTLTCHMADSPYGSWLASNFFFDDIAIPASRKMVPVPRPGT